MNQEKKIVPESISFGDDVMIFNAINELGLDEKLTERLEVESNFEIGNWITAGEELLRIKVHYYDRESKPKWSLRSDTTSTKEFSFNSPVSGLVIGFKNLYLADNSFGYTLFSPKKTFPTILLPYNEPIIENNIENIYTDFRNSLIHYKQRLCTWTEAKGYTRLGDAYNDNDILIKQANLGKGWEVKKYADIVDVTTRSENRSYTHVYQSTINKLRSNSLQLRDKLMHISE